jgi:DNA-binding MarR family transcriptional regulator
VLNRQNRDTAIFRCCCCKREHVMARFRPILNAHGIAEQQWRILRALIDTGPLEPREIGELCRISSPSLAGVLSRMEDLGYIKRKRLDHDQRRLRDCRRPYIATAGRFSR